MTRECYYCGVKIDTGHDEHYYCKCAGSYKAVCVKDHLSHERCPECGKPLHHKDPSYQKRVFKSPGDRGLLGF